MKKIKFDEPTTSVVAYCKCGQVIVAIDFSEYKNNKAAKKSIDDAFDMGYSIGKAPDQFVRENYDCKC